MNQKIVEEIDRDIFIERLMKYKDVSVDEAEALWNNLTELEQMHPRLQAILIAYGDIK